MTADNLLRFMLSNIRLATYDATALNNFWFTRVSKGLPLTTNQDALFRKILKTYRRQLLHLGINTDNIADIQWKIPPVETSADFQIARVRLEDSNLIIKTPYHKKFIEIMTNQSVFLWSKSSKHYIAPFSPGAFKQAYHTVRMFFDHVEWSNDLKVMLDNFAKHESSCDWNPTAHHINGRIIVSCLTNQLNDLLPKVLPVDIKTVARLQTFGILISPELVEAVSTNPTERKLLSSRIGSIDKEHLNELLSFLSKTECDFVQSEFPEKSAISKTVRNWALSTNTKSSIKGTGTGLYLPFNSDSTFSNAVYLHFTSSSSVSQRAALFARLVKITDSTPINLYA